jgi:hypothetical protein
VLHLPELLPIAVLAPGVVVEVLLAAGVVMPRRLDVTVRVGADPHVAPRGRDGQRADPLLCLGVVDRLAVLVHVAEAAAPANPSNAGGGTVDPP